jgi:hypothetical protein
MKVIDHLLFVTNSKLGHGPRRRTTYDFFFRAQPLQSRGWSACADHDNDRGIFGEELKRIAVAFADLAPSRAMCE